MTRNNGLFKVPSPRPRAPLFQFQPSHKHHFSEIFERDANDDYKCLLSGGTAERALDIIYTPLDQVASDMCWVEISVEEYCCPACFFSMLERKS